MRTTARKKQNEGVVQNNNRDLHSQPKNSKKNQKTQRNQKQNLKQGGHQIKQLASSQQPPRNNK